MRRIICFKCLKFKNLNIFFKTRKTVNLFFYQLFKVIEIPCSIAAKKKKIANYSYRYLNQQQLIYLVFIFLNIKASDG